MNLKGHRFRQSPEIFMSSARDQIFLSDKQGENYFHLNETATVIWKNLEKWKSYEELLLTLQKMYEDFKEEQFWQVNNLIEELFNKGVLQMEEDN